MSFTSRPNLNKKTKQISITIPKKKLLELNHRIPKQIKWKIEEMSF